MILARLFSNVIQVVVLSQLRTPDPDRSREVLRSTEEIELAKQEPAKPFVLVASHAK